jgi:hypothetical protein
MKATHAKTAEPDDCFFLACKNGTQALFLRISLVNQGSRLSLSYSQNGVERIAQRQQGGENA